ncbi:hypothetical protein F4561_000826 [Lipingzhangella halophila]|uniref:DUF6879 domain-containing protein n=1 Tax=Lipingzhangella halophila TaxID=1783352 RepID=A0A7W7RDJ0_9ACTN|nr:DUF6879 family protein [Lipingzhangella halophila]MBB4930006.1 hypothetical protein [Lipingzhangella halophila]
MTDSIFDQIRAAEGIVLDRSTYHADSDREQEKLDDGVIWKLERAQFFNEVGDSAWDAFVAGDWARVMEIFESEREAIRKDVRDNAAQGLEFRRVRIVEDPPTPYLRWESQSHRIFVECGHAIRALDAAEVAPLETTAQLPELMVYGQRVLYQVRYDDQWTPIGAKRVNDASLVDGAATAIAELWERSEPFLDYFERAISGLSVPRITRSD